MYPPPLAHASEFRGLFVDAWHPGFLTHQEVTQTGVDCLWDAATNGFSNYINPVAYTNQAPHPAWIVEEDLEDAGSIILIHDSSLFLPHYDNVIEGTETQCDSVPNKNFKFLRNLCTVFPE